jgi:tyrosyl-tRNA synthetase
VATIARQVAEGGAAANRAKREVARAIVALYHGAEQAQAAEERFNAIFRDHQLPTDAPEFRAELTGTVHLPALLTEAGLTGSSSEARRLIDAGGVRIDGTPVASRNYDLPGSELADRLLAVGKRKAVRVTGSPS